MIRDLAGGERSDRHHGGAVEVQPAPAGDAGHLAVVPDAHHADDVAVAGVGKEFRRVFAAALEPRVPRRGQVGGQRGIVARLVTQKTAELQVALKWTPQQQTVRGPEVTL